MEIVEWINQRQRIYKKIEPLVSRKLKLAQLNREVIHRLRLGKCSLNFYLNIIGKHATGYCSRYHVPETIEHFILQCPENLELAIKLKEQCMTEKIGVEITNVLKNDKTMAIIIDYVLIKTCFTCFKRFFWISWAVWCGHLPDWLWVSPNSVTLRQGLF